MPDPSGDAWALLRRWLTRGGTVDPGVTPPQMDASVTVQGVASVDLDAADDEVTVYGADGGGNGARRALYVDALGKLVPADQPGTLNNGTETAVSTLAVQVIAANANRKKLIIQNTGSANVRIGTTGLTATTGVRLTAGVVITFTTPYCPINAIFAIRETLDSIVLVQEVV
jgi:hypothetical protein